MGTTYAKLDSATVGAGLSTGITFSNISQAYKNLIIKVSSRDTDTGQTYFQLQFNGDTGSNYGCIWLGTTTGSSVTGGTEKNQTAVRAISHASNSDTANTFGSSEITVANYSSNTTSKNLSIDTIVDTTTTKIMKNFSGIYQNQSAITSVTVLPYTSFRQYTTVTLYGINNADVVAAPSAPTIGTATAVGPTNATVAFTASTGNPNSYTVTSSPGGITKTGNQSPILVTGLSATTAYTFTVVANNTAGSSAASAASNSITTGANTFVQPWSYTGNAYAALSGDGINWARVSISGVSGTIQFDGSTNAGKMGSTYYVGLGTSTTAPLSTSTDLISWTNRTVGGTAYAYLNKTANDGTTIVLAGGAGGYGSANRLKYSTNFTSWTDVTLPGTIYNSYLVTYGGGYFIVNDGDGNYCFSSNGTSWTHATAMWSTGGVGNARVYFNSRWITGGNGGDLRYTTTINPGAVWTLGTGFSTNQVQSMGQGGGYVVAGHNYGVFSYSTNGTSWSTASSPLTGQATGGVTYGNGLFVASTNNGQIGTSPTGATWTQRVSPSTDPYSQGYGNFYG